MAMKDFTLTLSDLDMTFRDKVTLRRFTLILNDLGITCRVTEIIRLRWLRRLVDDAVPPRRPGWSASATEVDRRAAGLRRHVDGLAGGLRRGRADTCRAGQQMDKTMTRSPRWSITSVARCRLWRHVLCLPHYATHFRSTAHAQNATSKSRPAAACKCTELGQLVSQTAAGTLAALFQRYNNLINLK